MPVQANSFTVHSDGVTLSGQESGGGSPIVLLHGLTATRRYVVMGSTALERSGHRVIAYDARGHGRSSPASAPRAYTYDRLSDDLLAVLDALGIGRATIAGASMGAHTALRFALEHPERVAGLGLVTPAYDPDAPIGPDSFEDWDRLARGLREGGVEGFVSAYAARPIPEQWRDTMMRALRQRLSEHEDPLALADALEAVPRSRPFASMGELGRIRVPASVVASRDESDPGHPLAIGERYAAAIPGATLTVEEPGSSPIAWQGARLSRILGELAAAAG